MALTTGSSRIHLVVKSVGPFWPLGSTDDLESANLSWSSIGNGGSTLYALQHLNDIYGDALSNLRVLLIHAGLHLLLVCWLRKHFLWCFVVSTS